VNHKTIDVQRGTLINETLTEFGSSFNVYDFVFDDAGHRTSIKPRAIQIPQGSLVSKTNETFDSVLTNIGFTPSTGEITYMNEDVKDLVLSGYTMGETMGNISSTDTIGTAFGKLELGLNNLRVE
jgi:hypothetical protein